MTNAELKKLEELATEEQINSAHVNAVDTTGEMFTDAYVEVYASTLRGILDEAGLL